jgi:hypothetical protein
MEGVVVVVDEAMLKQFQMKEVGATILEVILSDNPFRQLMTRWTPVSTIEFFEPVC